MRSFSRRCSASSTRRSRSAPTKSWKIFRITGWPSSWISLSVTASSFTDATTRSRTMPRGSSAFGAVWANAGAATRSNHRAGHTPRPS